MTYYAALDVGVRSLALCIIDDDGAVRLERSLPSEVDDIVACLRGFGEKITVVGLEAGTLTQWLTYGLRDAGFRPVVMEARHVKAALGAMRNKTDRNDAHGIAQILRSGWYREVHVKSLESHYVRTLLASRKSLLRTRIKQVVKALDEGDKEAAEDAYKKAVPVIDSMATKLLIHKNKAARHKSRLNDRIKAMA